MEASLTFGWRLTIHESTEDRIGGQALNSGDESWA